MRSFELIGRILFILENPRPQGLRLCLNLISNWCNQLAVKIQLKEALAEEDIRVWRILCPEESRAYTESGQIRLPFSKAPIHGEISWTKLSAKTFSDSSSLRETCEFIRDNWFSVFAVPDEEWRPYN